MSTITGRRNPDKVEVGGPIKGMSRWVVPTRIRETTVVICGGKIVGEVLEGRSAGDWAVGLVAARCVVRRKVTEAARGFGKEGGSRGRMGDESR